MNRAEARARLLRRAAAALALMVGLALVAFGVGKLVRARLAQDTTPTATQAKTSVPPPATFSGSATVPSATTPPVASSALRSTPLPTLVAPRPIERKVQLDLMPAAGVKVRVDDGPEQDVPSGTVLKVDGKAHDFSLTCAVCTTVHREIAAGDKDEVLSVRVPVKPATLVIAGAANMTYQIVEHPEISVRFGNNSIPMGRRSENVTVMELETQKTRGVPLVAGDSTTASF
jgi:hypothetical protein